MQRLQQLLDELVDAGAAGVVMHYHDQDGQWRGSSGVAELGTDRPVDPGRLVPDRQRHQDVYGGGGAFVGERRGGNPRRDV
jgi:hypothetical protein